MKKLIFIMAAIFTVSLYSCNQAGAGKASQADSTDTTQVDSLDSVHADSLVVDSVKK